MGLPLVVAAETVQRSANPQPQPLSQRERLEFGHVLPSSVEEGQALPQPAPGWWVAKSVIERFVSREAHPVAKRSIDGPSKNQASTTPVPLRDTSPPHLSRGSLGVSKCRIASLSQRERRALTHKVSLSQRERFAERQWSHSRVTARTGIRLCGQAIPDSAALYWLQIVFSVLSLVPSVLAAEGSRVSFVKDIVPILTKSGCANSNCHGSIRGQAEFKLSLFGYDPDLDYEAITVGSEGRRVNRDKAEESLILLKPTFQVPHGGGERFKVGSLEYSAILEWIREGATFDSPGSPRIESLTVSPEEITLIGIGSRAQLTAIAAYSDGSREDVTKTVQYSPNDESVVGVSHDGEIKTLRAGETAIMVRTLGKAVAARVVVVAEPPMKDYPAVPENNLIDTLVFSKLRRLNLIPSELSGDREFLRRSYLDTIGLLPTLEETEEFVHSQEPQKRATLIDDLLKRPEFAELWATKFSDLFRAGLLDQGAKGARLFYHWIRTAILEDKPYNEFATELITASGNLWFNPTANFYYITERSEPENIATNISQVFLGVRLECARCHNHPWEKWTQDDFWSFAAFFSRMGVKDTYGGDESEIFLKDSGEVIHPKTKKPVQAKYLDGPSATEGLDEDIREKLAQWITSAQNPWFARNIVNRLWKHYLGRGTVEPPDDFRITNPPSNEVLLDALTKDFLEHGYSVRHTVRTILNSRVYQLTSEPNRTNHEDKLNYSHYYPKRLMAEQLMDAISQVTGIPEKYQGHLIGARAMTIPSGAPSYFLETFGRLKDREKICERETQPDMAQTMHLISGQTIHKKIAAKGGTLDRWLEDPSLTDEEIVRRLFLATLVRPPSERELDVALAPIRSKGMRARREAFEDILWVIFNCKEFLFNH